MKTNRIFHAQFVPHATALSAPEMVQSGLIAPHEVALLRETGTAANVASGYSRAVNDDASSQDKLEIARLRQQLAEMQQASSSFQQSQAASSSQVKPAQDSEMSTRLPAGEQSLVFGEDGWLGSNTGAERKIERSSVPVHNTDAHDVVQSPVTLLTEIATGAASATLGATAAYGVHQAHLKAKAAYQEYRAYQEFRAKAKPIAPPTPMAAHFLRPTVRSSAEGTIAGYCRSSKCATQGSPPTRPSACLNGAASASKRRWR